VAIIVVVRFVDPFMQLLLGFKHPPRLNAVRIHASPLFQAHALKSERILRCKFSEVRNRVVVERIARISKARQLIGRDSQDLLI
jgi:hypothetical protein